jgi:hypothetical protein
VPFAGIFQEERMAEDRASGKLGEKTKEKWNFMQKYYHKVSEVKYGWDLSDHVDLSIVPWPGCFLHGRRNTGKRRKRCPEAQFCRAYTRRQVRATSLPWANRMSVDDY